MKYILIILICFIGLTSYGQVQKVPRSMFGTQVDSSIAPGKNLIIPVFRSLSDLARYQVLDSSGRLMFLRDSNAVFYRTNAHTWAKLLAGSNSGLVLDSVVVRGGDTIVNYYNTGEVYIGGVVSGGGSTPDTVRVLRPLRSSDNHDTLYMPQLSEFDSGWVSPDQAFVWDQAAIDVQSSIKTIVSIGGSSFENTHVDGSKDTVTLSGGGTTLYAGYGLLKRSDSTTLSADTSGGKLFYSKYLGQTIYCLGDSYTAGDLYQPALSIGLGATTVSNGINGATITGDATYPVASLASRINTALATTPDVIIIEGGTNDWFLGRTLGTISSTDTLTYYGALKYIAQRCASQTYDIKVFFVSMLPRGGSRSNYSSQKQYVDAMAEVAALYGFTLVDEFNGSGITYENLSLYCPDGVHPNSFEGRYRYGNYMLSSIIAGGTVNQAIGGTPGIYWNTSGNAGTDTLTNFIGTTDNKPLVHKINSNFAGALTDSTVRNTGYGYGALKSAYLVKSISNGVGEDNTAVGAYALKLNTIGQDNTALGANTLTSNTSGGGNSALGENALYSNTTGGGNNAFGQRALTTNTTGANNLAFGAQALRFNRTGSNNVGVGADALSANTTADGNTAVGYQSLKSDTTGTSNTAVGYNSQSVNIIGSNNTSIGAESLVSNTNSFNTAVGYAALNANTSGGLNTAIGTTALYNNTTGSNNTAVGIHAGRWVYGGVTSNTITNNSIYIGYLSQSLANNQTNEIVIGSNAVGAGSNSVVIGDSNITKTVLKGGVTLTTTADGLNNASLTTTQMNAISSPVDGKQIWNSTEKALFTYNSDWGWESNDFVWLTRNTLAYRNDFTATSVSASMSDAMMLTAGTSATTSVTTDNNHPGIWNLSTSTSSTGATSVGTGNGTTTQPILLGGGRILYEADVRVPTLSTSGERFSFISGLSATNNSNATSNGYLFLYDEGGTINGSVATTKWKVQNVNGGSVTTDTTLVTVTAGSWYRLTIVVNAANTSVDYYINGALAVTETANRPTVAMGIVNRIAKSVGTTARTVDIDYIQVKQRFTTAR